MPVESDAHELPPELQLLGSQLSRDAQSLAECYPARLPGDVRSLATTKDLAQGGRRAPWLLGGAAAAVLLALGGASFGLHSAVEEARRRTDANATSADAAVSNRLAGDRVLGDTVFGDTVPDDTVPQSVKTDHSREAARNQPFRVYPTSLGAPQGDESAAGSTPHASAPEWEALLDLTPPERWEGLELSL